jgi:hypothetical protein
MRAMIRINESDSKEPTRCPLCGELVFPSYLDIVDLDSDQERLCDKCSPESLALVADGADCWEHFHRLADLSDITIKRNIVGAKKKLTYSVAAQRPDGQLIVSTAQSLEDAISGAAHQCMDLEEDDDQTE